MFFQGEPGTPNNVPGAKGEIGYPGLQVHDQMHKPQRSLMLNVSAICRGASDWPMCGGCGLFDATVSLDRQET